jgi:hypothetical protein
VRGVELCFNKSALTGAFIDNLSKTKANYTTPNSAQTRYCR